MRSFVIFLALLLVCACGGGGGGGSGNPGDNNSDNNSDNNTDNSIITNFAEFKAIADNCSRDYILEANITVNEPWVAICSTGGGYTGTFDGGGKTVTFTNDISGGLFAKLGTNGKVKDIKIDIAAQANITGIDIATNENPTDFFNAFGAVAVVTRNNSIIDNCSVNIDQSFGAADYAGGLAGYAGSQISRCSVNINGTITAGNSAGGIAAYGNSSIDNCTVSLKQVDAFAAGGIAGYATYIENSYAVITSITGDEYAGGVAGNAGNIANSFAVVSGSIGANTDKDYASGYAGGVAGYTAGNITNSFAVVLDSIGATATGSGANVSSYAGGVTGRSYMISDSVAVVNRNKIINAVNKGGVYGGGFSIGNNYSYMSSSGNAEGEDGGRAGIAQLMSAEWWRSVGFDDSIWHLEAEKLPLQKFFHDKGIEAAELWPLIESIFVFTKDPAYLTGTFNCNANFSLTENVVITGEWTGLCNTATGYSGTFNGNNYTIIFKDNVTGGFFARLGNGTTGTIKNLNIEALKNINGLNVTYSISAGGVAAFTTAENSIIDSCTVIVNGNITAASYAGGVAGEAYGSVTNSSAIVYGNITASVDNSCAGGLVGYTRKAIDNSSATTIGNITAVKSAGGVAGEVLGNNSDSLISDSFAIVGGNIKTTASISYSGGVAGFVGNNGSIRSCFAVAGGKIEAAGIAGGVAGTSGAIRNSVAVMDHTKITGANKGNIWGYSHAGGGSNYFNYIFTKGGTGFNDANSQNGQAVSAANLKSRDWWRNVVGFGTNNWHIEDGYMPLPKALYDSGISPSPFPDWVKDN